jgi:hypothetical protein
MPRAERYARCGAPTLSWVSSENVASEGYHCKTVSDHRGSNSQAIDFESVKIYPIFTVKIENPGKSNT